MQAAAQYRIDRVRRWLDRSRVLADPTHALGQLALHALPEATGLSQANVHWALNHAFEVNASDDELRALVQQTVEAPAAHVLLSANVFVGALRAIAIALASSNAVFVRPSRREPLTADLLHRATPDAFALVADLRPMPGDHVWAYGADASLNSLKSKLPTGVCLHAHPSGFGVLVVDTKAQLTRNDFEAVALDVAAFDQRGCLSPRFVLLESDVEDRARELALGLLQALDRVAQQLPRGTTDAVTSADSVRHREIWRCLGEVLEGPGGTITLDLSAQAWGTPPSNRTLHVRLTRDPLADLVGLSDAITAVGSRNDPDLCARIGRALPKARWSVFGRMQRPPLDGPVDRRPDPSGIVLSRLDQLSSRAGRS